MPKNDFQRDLIYDLGMHRALDTKFYLDKGFRVVALEANPHFIAQARNTFPNQIASSQLALVEQALWDKDDETISFYLNAQKDDWSSAFKIWAEKEGHVSQEIRVSTTTLKRLFESFGVPYYIKCDIEGADEIFVRQLHCEDRKPAFVSVEAASLEVLAILFASGYDRVQIVNQAFNSTVRPPNPAREGEYVEVQFNGHMSGLFGRELEKNEWVKFSEAAENYLEHVRLQRRQASLAHGWLDFHVTTSVMLDA